MEANRHSENVELLRKVDAAVAELSEHCDTVQIFVTLHQGNEAGTCHITRGAGNWFARFGQILGWAHLQDATFGDGELDDGDD
jgi:hypothetical protein